MKKGSLRLQIPKPCEEDWNSMSPGERSRFCARCAREVIDFTSFSDAELLDFFRSRPGPVCGRLTSNQLNRTIYAPRTASPCSWPLAASFSLLLLGLPMDMVKAQPPLVTVSVPQIEAEEGSSNLSLSGLVLNEAGDLVANVPVKLFHGGKEIKECITNDAGCYSFENLPTGIYWIHVSMPGYYYPYVSDGLILKDKPLVFTINLSGGTNSEDPTIFVGFTRSIIPD